MVALRDTLRALALGATVATLSAAFWQAAEAQAPQRASDAVSAVADPQTGVLLAWHRLGEGEKAGSALFEIARDPGFAFVEVSYLPEGAIAPQLDLPGPAFRTASLTPSDVYAACARAAERGVWAPPETLPIGETRLFRPARMDAGATLDARLTQGSCVLARGIEQPKARYYLADGFRGIRLIDRNSGEEIANLDDGLQRMQPIFDQGYATQSEGFWKLFGLPRSSASIQDIDDRRSDPTTADELIRALRGPRVMQLAALNTIANRFVTGASLGSARTVRTFWIQRTPAAVGEALAASSLMTDINPRMRVAALLAAAAIPEADESLGPEILDALEKKARSFPHRLDRYDALHEPDRDEPLARPNEMEEISDAVALAAAHFGGEWARRVLDKLEDDEPIAAPSRGRIGLLLLLAEAEDADERAARLVRAAHPRALDSVVELSLTMPIESPALAQAWRDKCRGLPSPPRDCVALLARYGDANALRALELALQNEARVSGDRGLTPLFAQESLFNDVGPRGIAILYRHISSPPVVAYRAVSELCKLGPHAGPGVAAQAATLSQELPQGFAPAAADAATLARDETNGGFGIRTALRRCRASQPTLEGRYRLAAP